MVLEYGGFADTAVGINFENGFQCLSVREILKTSGMTPPRFINSLNISLTGMLSGLLATPVTRTKFLLALS